MLFCRIQIVSYEIVLQHANQELMPIHIFLYGYDYETLEKEFYMTCK